MNVSRFIDTNNRMKTFDPWVNNLIDNLRYDGSGRSVSRFPAVNVAESAEGYRVEFAVPGFSKEEFKISIEKDVLTVSGEHKAESLDEKTQYSRREFSYSSFKRAFTLPESVDTNKIEANYKDGVLILAIAKKEEVKPVVKEISVK
ncbi:Hsp20/alpha crystallin family protein [Olivibacter sp. XZL3]|uniref:Hsp20/alpha crystallin family protein n=1 Tax=Olivibacter sp. XZL3 TaxID=1735116 RepID=UPI001064F1D9|nr:Hsp20/alpha crystallin family protein [Olivibacter sp. XZL3]